MENEGARSIPYSGEDHGHGLPAAYLGYFDCFNRGEFFEAHAVLETLWLAERRGPNADFFKGLIQFAGAFVHLQKDRLRPAAALFRLSRRHLQGYPARHWRLEVLRVLDLIDAWHGRLAAGRFKVNPLATDPPPVLSLELPRAAVAPGRSGSAPPAGRRP